MKPKKTKEETKDAQKDKRLFQTYGIRLEDWETMLRDQSGVCCICLDRPGSGVLCVDHVHVKGFKKMVPEDKKAYVRGLLCFLCNVGLKGFEKTSDGLKNRQRLEGTCEYFKKFKLKGEL